MAKSTASLLRVTGLKATTLGMLQGTFFSLIGLVVAISYSISAVVKFTESTESILRGMTFGLAHGFVAIILIPIAYFIAGWIIGLLYGVIINAVLESSGGLVLKTENDGKADTK
ncbi:MAG TPA: hypothetical protein PKD28_03865 [Candidatus Saccharibacteria bacterium]|nr:hypothetical protein [Candidatus Saccharibacteria bacterium]